MSFYGLKLGKMRIDSVNIRLQVIGLKYPSRAVLFAPILHRAKFAGDCFR